MAFIMISCEAMTKSIQLLAIDLDGTLLNSAKQITAETADTLRRARLAGVRVILASARPPRSTRAFYEQLDLDTPVINYNGALVQDPMENRVLLHRPIPFQTARSIVDLARGMYPEVLVSAEILDRWYTDRVDDRYLTESAKQAGPDVMAPIETWLHEPLTKLLLLGAPERLTAIALAVRQRYPHDVTMVQTEDFLLQIMHATVSKAQALRVVAASLAIHREHVMAIGDNANDVGMLQWAALGVAVANAALPAIAVADVVTDHHDADGVAKIVRKVILGEG